MISTFRFSGFFMRFLCALTLVFLTFNPSGYSFFHAVTQTLFALPVLVLSGVILAIGWVIFLRATLRSLGIIGLLLVTALFACIAWVAVYYGLLTVDTSIFSYLVLVIVAIILGIGMSWSHIRRRMSGQVDTDDVDQ